MRIAAAWSWRMLAILAVIAVLIFIVIQLRLIVIPLLVATLLAALLVPFVQFLQRHRWPKWLAVMLAELGLIGVVTALVFLVVAQVRAGFPDLQVQSVAAWEQFKQFLLESPLHLTDAQITAYADQIWNSVQQDSQVWVTGALTVGSSAGHFLAGPAAHPVHDPVHPHRRSRHVGVDGTAVPQAGPRGRRPVRSGGLDDAHLVRQGADLRRRDRRSRNRTRCTHSGIAVGDPHCRRGLPRIVHPHRRRRRHRSAGGVRGIDLQGRRDRADHARHRASRAAGRGPRSAAAGDGKRRQGASGRRRVRRRREAASWPASPARCSRCPSWRC